MNTNPDGPTLTRRKSPVGILEIKRMRLGGGRCKFSSGSSGTRGWVFLHSSMRDRYLNSFSYQTSLKVYRDWKSVIDTARDEGREEGREEGLRAAMAEALAGLQASGMPEAKARRLLGITG
jgi:hypothetical protein